MRDFECSVLNGMSSSTSPSPPPRVRVLCRRRGTPNKQCPPDITELTYELTETVAERTRQGLSKRTQGPNLTKMLVAVLCKWYLLPKGKSVFSNGVSLDTSTTLQDRPNKMNSMIFWEGGRALIGLMVVFIFVIVFIFVGYISFLVFGVVRKQKKRK